MRKLVHKLPPPPPDLIPLSDVYRFPGRICLSGSGDYPGAFQLIFDFDMMRGHSPELVKGENGEYYIVFVKEDN